MSDIVYIAYNKSGRCLWLGSRKTPEGARRYLQAQPWAGEVARIESQIIASSNSREKLLHQLRPKYHPAYRNVAPAP